MPRGAESCQPFRTPNDTEFSDERKPSNGRSADGSPRPRHRRINAEPCRPRTPRRRARAEAGGSLYGRERCAYSRGRSSYRSPAGLSRSGRRIPGRSRWTWGQSPRLECRECLEWLEWLECLECLEWLVCLECLDYLEADLRPLDAAVELSADLRADRRLRLGVEPQVVDRFECQFVSPAVWTINLHRGSSLQCRGSTAKEALGFPCRVHLCCASVPGKSTARRWPRRSRGTSNPRARKRRASRASGAEFDA